MWAQHIYLGYHNCAIFVVCASTNGNYFEEEKKINHFCRRFFFSSQFAFLVAFFLCVSVFLVYFHIKNASISNQFDGTYQNANAKRIQCIVNCVNALWYITNAILGFNLWIETIYWYADSSVAWRKYWEKKNMEK